MLPHRLVLPSARISTRFRDLLAPVAVSVALVAPVAVLRAADVGAQGCVHWSEEQFAPAPGARLGSAMVYDSARNKLILFGGRDPDESGGFGILYGDTW